MKSEFITVLFGAALVLLSIPAFLSGYGPAPFYRPSVGVPASQRGQSEETIIADRKDTNTALRESDAGMVGEPVTSVRQPVTSSSGVHLGY